MTYREWILKVRLTILIYNSNENKFYILGLWRYHLFEQGIDISQVLDFDDITWDIVKDNLLKDLLYLNKLSNVNTAINAIILLVVLSINKTENDNNE